MHLDRGFLVEKVTVPFLWHIRAGGRLLLYRRQVTVPLFRQVCSSPQKSGGGASKRDALTRDSTLCCCDVQATMFGEDTSLFERARRYIRKVVVGDSFCEGDRSKSYISRVLRGAGFQTGQCMVQATTIHCDGHTLSCL